MINGFSYLVILTFSQSVIFTKTELKPLYVLMFLKTFTMRASKILQFTNNLFIHVTLLMFLLTKIFLSINGVQKIKICSSFGFTLLFFLLSYPICFGQKEHHTKSIINDSIVHREMDYFTIAGASGNKDYSDMSKILKEIPLTYSGDSVVELEKADLYSTHWAFYISFKPFDTLNHSITYGKDSIILAIDDHSCYGISNRLPKRQVSRIDFFHEKYRVRLPKNAFDGIYEVPIYYCKTKKDRKKPQHYFKAYLSNDNRRKYLYMLNGEGKDRYEVTWVMDGYDYYGRFINKVPN